MAYQFSIGNLQKIFTRALEDPELEADISRLSEESKDKLLDVSTVSDSVWSSAPNQIKKLQNSEHLLESLINERKNRSFLKTILIVFRGPEFQIISVILALIGSVVSIFEYFNFSLSFYPLAWGYTVLILVTGITLVIFIPFGRFYYREKKSETDAKVIVQKQIIELEDAIYTLGAKPIIREHLSEYINPSFDSPLRNKDARGLGELADPKYTVPTIVRDDLEKKVSRMKSGSIGIAGQRGSGKSTLLRAICGTRPSESGKSPKLTMLVSVPVKYDPREFILSLFSILCLKVLELEKDPFEDSSERFELRMPAIRIKSPVFSIRLTFLLLTVAMIGILSIALSLQMIRPAIQTSRDLATVTAMADQTQSATITPASTQPIISTPSPLPSLNGVEGITSLSANSGVVQSLTLLEVITAFGIQPLPIFILGFFLTIFSIALLFWSYFIQRAQRTARRKSKAINETMNDLKIDDPVRISRLLNTLAHQWLAKIRFQQSYSTGWGGSLDLPAGININIDQAIELSENQLNLPEIVDGYRKFMEQVTRKYEVIIGIDEMDKMGSGENARQFLNEVKSIFGISKCFYLISISDNAMSSFERRGLPFRDEFDSAFDDVIYVDYLKYVTALKLLWQRVIAIPPKFSYFCYAMSGGLPRDLIRICREIIHMTKEKDGDIYFKEINQHIMNTDMLDKIRAGIVSATYIDSEPRVSVFLGILYALERDIDDPEAWKRSYRFLFHAPMAERGTPEAEQKIEKLYYEFSAYLLYMISLREFFNILDDEKQSEITRKALAESYIDSLADTKQAMADNPRLAISLLDEWRKSVLLKPIL